MLVVGLKDIQFKNLIDIQKGAAALCDMLPSGQTSEIVKNLFT